METDLLFTAIKTSDWKSAVESGKYEPDIFKEEGFIPCYPGDAAEEVINREFSSEDEVFLLVVDPVRIQDPIKHQKENDIKLSKVLGSFSIDAIIDKIKLERDAEKGFSVRVKHFD